jgi:hypothetical protein
MEPSWGNADRYQQRTDGIRSRGSDLAELR